MRKQRVTSRTKDLVPFPSTIKVRLHDPDFHQLYIERTPEYKRQLSKFHYKGFLWVFSNVSGLLTVDNSGKVTSCNDNFLRIFLGYFETELIGKVCENFSNFDTFYNIMYNFSVVVIHRSKIASPLFTVKKKFAQSWF